MSVQRVAARYAKALIEIAEEKGKLDVVHGDVLGFLKTLENRDFELLVKSPIVKGDTKQRVVKALFGGKMDAITLNFLNILINKGREVHLPEVAAAFIEGYKVLKNITTVKLITAAPVSSSVVEAIKVKIIAALGIGGTLDLQTAVDKKLIGGFVIEISDKLYNASISHQLEQLKKEFNKNTYIKNL